MKFLVYILLVLAADMIAEAVVAMEYRASAEDIAKEFVMHTQHLQKVLKKPVLQPLQTEPYTSD